MAERVAQLDAVAEWLAREVEAGRLPAELPVERLAQIASIVLGGGAKPRGKNGRRGPASPTAPGDVAYDPATSPE